jgi:hypothetical protein
VHGWSVPSGDSTFDMTINAVQGYDISVKNIPDGPFAAGDMIPITLEISHDMNLGDVLYGSVLLGPSLAPGLVEVPVVVTAVAVTVELPLVDDTWVSGGDTAKNHMWDNILIARPTGLDNVLLSFDRDALPVGADVTEAKLCMNAVLESGAFGKQLMVTNVDPYDASTVTFDTAPSYYNPGPGLDVAMGKMAFDATEQIKAWDAMGAPGNWQLAVAADGPLGRVSFYSKEGANAQQDPSLAPRLKVTYIPQRD